MLMVMVIYNVGKARVEKFSGMIFSIERPYTSFSIKLQNKRPFVDTTKNSIRRESYDKGELERIIRPNSVVHKKRERL